MVYTYEMSAHGDPKLSVFVKSRWVQLLLSWNHRVKVMQETPSLSQWPPPFFNPFSSCHSYGLPITRGLHWPICVPVDTCCKFPIFFKSLPSFIILLGEYWAQLQSRYYTFCRRGFIYLYHNSHLCGLSIVCPCKNPSTCITQAPIPILCSSAFYWPFSERTMDAFSPFTSLRVTYASLAFGVFNVYQLGNFGMLVWEDCYGGEITSNLVAWYTDPCPSDHSIIHHLARSQYNSCLGCWILG